MKIAVLDALQLNDLDWSKFRRLGEMAIYDATRSEQVLQRAAGAQALLINKVRLTRETLEQLPDLRYIGVLATGFDNVDIQAACERGITVANIPGYSTDSVAQTVFALILELCQHVGKHSDGVKDCKKWSNQSSYCYWDYPLVELAGKTMGILGMGKIGWRVASVARAFGMNVVGCSRTRRSTEEGFTWVDFDTLLLQSDILSVHCPLTEETRALMNHQAFSKMKSSAIFINTSRGGIVDEPSLAQALNEGRIAGAGLDVLSTEPPAQDNPLLNAPNCVITPHIAWATKEARERLVQIAWENLAAYLSGFPQNVVNS